MAKNKSTVIAVVVAVFIIAFFFVASQKASYADKDELAKALPVKACTQDSNCVLTGSGACGGLACPTAVNKNYKTIWESTPDSEAFQKACAVVGACVSTNYVAKCAQAECGAGAECMGNTGGMCTAVPIK